MSTMLTQRKRVLVETAVARDKARNLLQGLIDARDISEQRLSASAQHDLLKRVTGASSMDNAIRSTKRMIDTLDRTLEQFSSELSDDDLALLDE